jgi:hypothetical protein
LPSFLSSREGNKMQGKMSLVFAILLMSHSCILDLQLYSPPRNHPHPQNPNWHHLPSLLSCL